MNYSTIDISHVDCPTETPICTECTFRYTGDYCEIDIFDIQPLFILIVLNQSLGYATLLFVLIWTVYGIVVKIRQGYPLLNLGMMSVYLMSVATVIRGVGSVDPGGVYLVYSLGFATACFYGSNILYFSASTLAIASWFDVIQSMKKVGVKVFLIPKIVTICVSVLSVVVLALVLGYAVFTQAWNDAVVALAGYSAIVIVSSIILIFIYLPKVWKIVSSSASFGNKSKLERRNYFVIFYQVHLFMVLCSSITYIILRTAIPKTNPTYPLLYWIFQLALIRTTELSFSVSTLLMIFDWFPAMQKDTHRHSTKVETKVFSTDEFTNQKSNA